MIPSFTMQLSKLPESVVPLVPRPTFLWRRILIGLLVLTLGVIARGGNVAHAAAVQGPDAPSGPVAYRNARPGVAYVGSKVCAGCHGEIYDSYIRTDMGRSMALPGQNPVLQSLTDPVSIFNKRVNEYLQVFRRNSDFYQSIYAVGADGKELFRHDEKLTYVVGSGANGYGFLIQRGDYLFEAPLSYYTSSRTWGLSPSYEKQNYGFSRPVIAACIVCHSGRPRPNEAKVGLFNDPPFEELAIGCENCHGPGELHVKERARGTPLAGPADRAIVNPAKLPGSLANSICMRCHQGGDVRVLQPGKHWTDFFPGTPLDDSLALFKVPLQRPTPPQSVLLEHYFSMMLSKCYRASGGGLTCVGCHDPHQEFTGEKKVEFYRRGCLNCHKEESCSLPLPTRQKQSPADDCAGCHMPRRTVIGIEHAALTEHRILKRQDEPFPEEAYHAASADSPGLIDLTAPGRRPIAPLTLVQAYNQLILEGHADYADYRAALLKTLTKTQPDNLQVLSALARQAALQHSTSGTREAIKDLSRAVRLGSTVPDDFLLLAELCADSGEMPRAIETLKRGIALAPYTRELYESLAVRYVKLGQYGDAVEIIQKGLKIYPEDKLLRILLEQVKPALLTP